MKKVTKPQSQQKQQNKNRWGFPKNTKKPKTDNPSPEFTRTLAREIVKNLAAIGQLTTRPFHREKDEQGKPVIAEALGEDPIIVDTSVCIDSRIALIVSSGFLSGTLILPQFVLAELQHIADSADLIRRTKGRRGLEVVSQLKNQKGNDRIHVKITSQDALEVNEVDHKLIALAKRHKAKLLTVDFNLAQLARAQGVKVLNINDLAQAMKIALIPSEELVVTISHEGKEREQGVGYLDDGTMIVVDDAKTKVGQKVNVVVTKIHQTPAGQLFFARIK
jgi:uncharacterized protein YacL